MKYINGKQANSFKTSPPTPPLCVCVFLIFLLTISFCLWCSRLSLRRDTCCVVAVSLNMAQQSSTVVWHTSNLAFDSSYCVPVPRPIGKLVVNTQVCREVPRCVEKSPDC